MEATNEPPRIRHAARFVPGHSGRAARGRVRAPPGHEVRAPRSLGCCREAGPAGRAGPPLEKLEREPVVVQPHSPLEVVVGQHRRIGRPGAAPGHVWNGRGRAARTDDERRGGENEKAKRATAARRSSRRASPPRGGDLPGSRRSRRSRSNGCSASYRSQWILISRRIPGRAPPVPYGGAGGGIMHWTAAPSHSPSTIL